MAALASAWLAACTAPEPGPPPLLRAAARQTRTGEEAYLTGHAAEAVPALEEAARLHLAAGDLPGAAQALLNLALAQRAAGDAAAAAATAARLRQLAPAAAQQESERGGDAAASAASGWLDALLALDRNDLAEAAGLVAHPPGKFGRASPWPGRLETLQGEISLGQGRLPDALAHARAGRSASAAARDRAEEARALRIAGSAQMALARWADARADFLAAIKIEESLGGGSRMVDDLNHLATVSAQLGDSSASQLYRDRAQAISAAH